MAYIEVLQKYAVFEGRASRSEYWLFTLANGLIAVVLFALTRLVHDSFIILYLVYALAVVIPSLAVGVRRLHDTDRSGWWLLIAFIPFAAFVLIVFMVIGSDEDNQYGPRPG